MLARQVTLLEEAIQSEEFQSRSLDENLLTDFHYRICGSLVPEWAGKWRLEEICVGRLTPPAPHQLPMLMREYALDLTARWEEAKNGNIDLAIEFLAFAERRFLTIHPFRDFNGRAIRAFLVELLRRLDYPLVNLTPEIGLDRDKYFAALEAADERDW